MAVLNFLRYSLLSVYRKRLGVLLFKISKVLVFYGKKIGDFALATIIKVTRCLAIQSLSSSQRIFKIRNNY